MWLEALHVTNGESVGATIVALDGEFDLAQRHRVVDAFDAAASDSLVVVDLERASYIDSTVLSCLIRLRGDVAERDGTLVLAALAPMVKRLFEIAGLTSLFETRSTIEEVCAEYGFQKDGARRIQLVADVIDS
jgi:anti-sigma B factor antagonist